MTIRLSGLLSRLACLVALAGCLVGCGRDIFDTQRYLEAEVRELALLSFDEAERFVEVGNLQIAIDRFDRALAISSRPRVFFERAKVHEELGDDMEAALNFMQALGGAPDYQEARFALLELGYKPPTEDEIKTDPGVYEAFAADVELDVQTRRAALASGEGPMTPEELRELQERIKKRIELASQHRLPTVEEIRALIFAQAISTDRIPRATDDLPREIVINTYEYHFANGQRFQRNREYEKAAEEYKIANEIDPTEEDAKVNLGDCIPEPRTFTCSPSSITCRHWTFSRTRAKPLLKMGQLS